MAMQLVKIVCGEREKSHIGELIQGNQPGWIASLLYIVQMLVVRHKRVLT